MRLRPRLLECDAVIEARGASIEEVEAAVVIVVEENGAGLDAEEPLMA